MKVFRLLIESNFVSFQSVITWADYELCNGSKDEYLFDLSLSGGKGTKEVLHVLIDNDEMEYNDTILKSIYGFVGLVFNNDHTKLEPSCRLISNVALEFKGQENPNVQGDDLYEWYRLYNETSHGDVLSLIKQIQNITEKYHRLGLSFAKQINFNFSNAR